MLGSTQRIVAGAAVASLALAAWVITRPATPTGQVVRPAGPVAASPPPVDAAGPVGSGCTLKPGDRLAFEGVEHSQLTLDFMKLRRAMPDLTREIPAGIHEVDLKVAWRVELVVDPPAGLQEAGWLHLRGTWTLRKAQSDVAVAKQLPHAPVPLAFDIAPDCSVHAEEVATEVNHRAAMRVVQALRDLSFAWPPAGARIAQVLEQIEAAEVKTTYRIASEDGRRLVGRFSGIERSLADADSDQGKMIGLPTSGIKAIHVADAPWFETIDASRKLASLSGTTKGETHVHIVAARPDAAWTVPTSSTRVVDVAALVQAGEDADVLRTIERYKAYDLEQMFALMEQMEKDGQPVRAQINALTYWLLGHQDQIPGFTERTHSPDTPRRRSGS